jgi:hypothetical protein
MKGGIFDDSMPINKRGGDPELGLLRHIKGKAALKPAAVKAVPVTSFDPKDQLKLVFDKVQKSIISHKQRSVSP